MSDNTPIDRNWHYINTRSQSARTRDHFRRYTRSTRIPTPTPNSVPFRSISTAQATHLGPTQLDSLVNLEAAAESPLAEETQDSLVLDISLASTPTDDSNEISSPISSDVSFTSTSTDDSWDMGTTKENTDLDLEVVVNLIKHIDPTQVQPHTGELYYHDVLKFRHTLGSALAKIPCAHKQGGYAWISDTKEDYKYRLKIDSDTFELPQPPTEPAEPNDQATSSEYKLYTTKYTKYEKYLLVNQQALHALKVRFPKALVRAYDKFMCLPINYTIRKALDKLIAPLQHATQLRRASLKLRVDVMAKTWEANSDGPGEFFIEMRHLKYQMDKTGYGLSYSDLILHCTEAIWKSGLPKDLLEKVNQSYSPTTEGEEEFQEFSEHYDTEIQKLYQAGLVRAQDHVANRLSALETAVESAAIATDHRLEAIDDRLDEVTVVTNPQAPTPVPKENIPPPSDVSTLGTAFTTGGFLEQVQALQALQTLLANQPVQAPSSNKNKPKQNTSVHKEWKQWQFWCHSCGCNLTHNSAECTRPKAGHKHDATFENPMDGNTKRNHLRNKWFNPTTRRPHDSKPTSN